MVTTSPVANKMSASSNPSWKKPCLKEEDSTPMPTMAPPTVIVRSSGTTRGTRPSRRHSAVKVSKVAQASTSTQSSCMFTSSTCAKPLRSRRDCACSRAPICCGRKVLEVVALNILMGPGCFATRSTASTLALYSARPHRPAGFVLGPTIDRRALQSKAMAGKRPSPQSGWTPRLRQAQEASNEAANEGWRTPSTTSGNRGQTIAANFSELRPDKRNRNQNGA
mmetsp:Transcript_106375/g.297849  ORF Transcript_106375/g.297849 Transcript_106375/m.297849 type:complete len:223 (-) Transcript_106375:8-676(-)